MSLQDEFLELNAVYQSVAAENEALRALVRDYMQAAAELMVHVSIGARRITGLDELQDRAHALLGEEQQS